MKITRTSPLTHLVNTLEIDVTWDQLEAHRNGALIQDAMPHLTPDEREFIKTGYTPQDWRRMFGAG